MVKIVCLGCSEVKDASRNLKFCESCNDEVEEMKAIIVKYDLMPKKIMEIKS